jgi:hypothetical protein
VKESSRKDAKAQSKDPKKKSRKKHIHTLCLSLLLGFAPLRLCVSFLWGLTDV